MTLAMDKPAFAPRPKRWTKREYNAMVERGAFVGQRLYLYRGELIEMEPMGARHARAIQRIMDRAYEVFRPSFGIRCQMPFNVPGESMPEPDTGIFTAAQLATDPHPSAAMLIVEVSDSSLAIDEEKAFDYAAAGVPEYWIVDVINRRLVAHRQPVADANAPVGFKHASVQTLDPAAAVSPLANPSLTVRVDQFLPGT
jgi:Uma2 family endonuclease